MSSVCTKQSHKTCGTITVLKFHITANKMAYANNAGPDQTASSEAVWSGPALFAIPPQTSGRLP